MLTIWILGPNAEALWSRSKCGQNHRCIVYGDAGSVLERVARARPEAVMIDDSFGGDGATIAQRIRRTGYDGYIIVNGPSILPFLDAGVVTMGSTNGDSKQLERLVKRIPTRPQVGLGSLTFARLAEPARRLTGFW